MDEIGAKRLLKGMAKREGSLSEAWGDLHTLTEPGVSTAQRKVAYGKLRVTFRPVEIAEGKKAWNVIRVVPR